MGVVVKMPDWWKRRGSRRPLVQVTLGGQKPGGLGLSAMLDFSVDVVLDGERLTKLELKEILASRSGMALLRGRWVEVDPEKLQQVLAHWESVQAAAAEGGFTFAEGMRLLAGADAAEEDAELESADQEKWSSRVAGSWFAEMLSGLSRADSKAPHRADRRLKAVLRPYQKVGVNWLWKLKQLGLGGCLADDMGLGKTIQVLGLLLRSKDTAARGASLLVVPASLLSNWVDEIRRFAPSLKTLVAHPSVTAAAELRASSHELVSGYDVMITSYGFLRRLEWAKDYHWDVVVLDEAQAIKNPSAKQTRLVKALHSGGRFALTGTPVENRLSDLWSIFDFINSGLLGSATSFARFSKRLEDRSENRYGPLRALVRPYILRRLKSDRSVIADLPDKTEVNAFCSLTKTQAALYQDAVKALAASIGDAGEGIRRRGVVLSFLSRFKQICNHPSHWLGDGAWDAGDSGKFTRLREICEAVSERQEKVLVFTQYREVTRPLNDFLAGVFGRPGVTFDGATPVKKRRVLVERFQNDESVPFFVISLKAGGTGLNLTAASHVIHFDRWWNPAVEDQATDRAYRIGQKKNVLVHKFVCRGTVEEKIDALMQEKRQMSDELLDSGGDVLITELGDKELLNLVALDLSSALQES